MIVIDKILYIALSAAPWIILGFFLAGLIKGFIPDTALRRYVGGTGLLSTVRAALIGMPLPLCSCGAVPAAMSLHRGGAGSGPATAFLISTPGIGVDSLTITYALLGPVMTAARVIGSIITAVVTGMLVSAGSVTAAEDSAGGDCGECCTGECGSVPEKKSITMAGKLTSGLKYSFIELLDDMSRWLFGGIVLAGCIIALVPPSFLESYGSGFGAKFIFAFAGIPMYICAAAATPIAAAMLITGVSPGTVLVFLLAGPVTSMATLGVYHKELGRPALFRYIAGIMISVIFLGIIFDVVLNFVSIDIQGAAAAAVTEVVPLYIEWISLIVLIVLSIKPLRGIIFRS